MPNLNRFAYHRAYTTTAHGERLVVAIGCKETSLEIRNEE